MSSFVQQKLSNLKIVHLQSYNENENGNKKSRNYQNSSIIANYFSLDSVTINLLTVLAKVGLNVAVKELQQVTVTSFKCWLMFYDRSVAISLRAAIQN